ncbi:MAG: DUF5317 domain-containing protein [Candidatus Aerophobetes bacterium]|nr:DUF5317 domain-containing protein [Candidatus Aerophobetes bacterium]
MLLDVMVFSLIVGLLRRGRWEGLANLPIKKVGLIISAFLIQYILVFFGERGFQLFSKIGVYLHIFSYVLLLMALLYSREIKGMKLIGIGVAINFIAILANGGQMPVSAEALLKADMNDMLSLLYNKSYVVHTLLTEKSHLKFLTDIIPLPHPYPKPRVLSVGDIVMSIGLFILIQCSMVKKKGK